MGFERLCMVLQKKTSTYDTDIFFNLIKEVSRISKVNYGDNDKTDIAIRVIVDHIRAIVFAIADGQLPSNTGAGYVIRRILRRAVRYAYTYLSLHKPFLYQLTTLLANQFKDTFPELNEQESMISDVIKEEENTFLKTLGKGLSLINKFISELDPGEQKMTGKAVFELYDTYGFPPDLTSLILKENKLSYNTNEFDNCMQQQKDRSRSATEMVLGEWIIINKIPIEGFLGYDDLEIIDAQVVKYRYATIKGDKQIHIVFNKTPFYPEGGGQIGDEGDILFLDKKNNTLCAHIYNTIKENNLIIHIADTWLDKNGFSQHYTLRVNTKKRLLTRRNHSATHLLHRGLIDILGEHVEQKGSYVGPDYLRFDFSHFKKIDNKQLLELERKINQQIILGGELEEFRHLPIKEAKKMDAIALFGEKYGEYVRVVKFTLESGKSNSIELCGGTHVTNIFEIGFLKIISESSIASGIRRIEAVTSEGACKFLNHKINTLHNIEDLFKNSDHLINSVQKLIDENHRLNILANNLHKDTVQNLIKSLDSKIRDYKDIKLLTSELNVDIAKMKDISFSLIQKYPNLCLALATRNNKKIILNVGFSKQLIQDRNLNASKIINKVGVHINAKGGGQPFFSVASGDKIKGIEQVFKDFEQIIIGF